MTIECPFCKWQISSDASRCPHCTSDLTAFQANRSKHDSDMFGFLVGVGVLCGIQWVLAWFWSLFSGAMPKASFYWAFKWIYDTFFWIAELISSIVSWSIGFLGLNLPVWIPAIALSILIARIFTSKDDWSLSIVVGLIIAAFLLFLRIIS
jgi:hypothetical protein